MHYTSFAIRLAYSFQIPGGKGTLGGSPARRRRRGGGRGGGAETCSVKAMGAQTMARFSAGVLSQLWATAQKTQTNEEAEASGADPGSGAREARGVAADPPHPAAQREAWGWQCPSRVPLGLSAARPAVPGAGWLCLPCSPWEAAFITEARSGGACAQGSEQALQTAAAAGRLPPNPGRARVVLATAAPRQSSSFQGSGWCARARGCARVCVPRHACAPYTGMLLLTGRGGDGSHGCQGCGACRSSPARWHRRSGASAQDGHWRAGSKAAAQARANHQAASSQSTDPVGLLIFTSNALRRRWDLGECPELGYLHIFRMVPLPRRKGDKPLGGNREICGAQPCPPAPTPKSARAGGGGATGSSSDSRRRPGTWSTPPGNRSGGGLRLFLALPRAPGVSHRQPANLHSGPRPLYPARLRTAVSGPTTNRYTTTMRAARREGGGGDAPPRPPRGARDAGPGRAGHRVKGARPQRRGPPARCGTAAICSNTPVSPFGFPKTL